MGAGEKFEFGSTVVTGADSGRSAGHTCDSWHKATKSGVDGSGLPPPCMTSGSSSTFAGSGVPCAVNAGRWDRRKEEKRTAHLCWSAGAAVRAAGLTAR